MSLFNRNILVGASGAQGYQISRSVRLRSSASAYLSRTPASAGNRKTWTWSGWVKRGTLGNYLLGAQANGSSGTSRFNFYFSSDALQIEEVTIGIAAQIVVTTTQVFRDPSAWYHIVLAMDTPQATASNRVKLYINGVQVTSFSSTTYPSQNFDTALNNAVANYHGYSNNNGTIQYFDGYLTEVNFIDGQALTPSSFGETNPVTGVWQPKKYAGTYGTNGFYLNFSDNSAATAAAIGKDYSGNGNNWTPNNISVTAGVTYDSMLDVPTPYADGGNGRGNYATWNPNCSTASTTYSNANLTVSRSSVATDTVLSTMAFASGGKYYVEMSPASVSGSYPTIGIEDINIRVNINSNPAVRYQPDGTISVNGVSFTGFATYIANDIIGIAVDPASGKYWFSKNGTWQNGDPVAGTITTATVSTSINWCPAVGAYNGVGAITLNCGQRPFAYTPPTGFKALNTQNLPEPAIVDGRKQFNAVLYTGNGSTQSITGVGFQPDLVWTKGRGSATFNNHLLYDHVRGVQRIIQSNSTAAEGVVSNGLTSFNSNGFSIGSFEDGNTNNNAYVAWNWKANGAGVTNTAGTITSTVSANTTSGFSVVTYTGTGANATVGHGLGVAPKMVIFKKRNTAVTPGSDWAVYHASIGPTAAIRLNLTNTPDTTSAYFNNTAPTSSVFSVGNANDTNISGGTYVAYLFAEVAGFSKFGRYTGNGSADGTFVFTGFRPRYVMIKNISTTGDWWVVDTARSTVNVASAWLNPNLSNAESSAISIDLLSNGFKFRSAAGNDNGQNWIYAAFAENAFKVALAR